MDFSAVFSGIGALGELFVLSLQLLASLLNRLFGRKNNDQANLDSTGSTVAVSVFLVGVILVCVYFGNMYAQQLRVDRTRAIVTRIAAAHQLQLDQEKADLKSGVPRKALVFPKFHQEKDNWGMPIRIVDDRRFVRRVVTVSSAGLDGEFETADDIIATSSVLLKKGEIAQNVIRHAAKNIRVTNAKAEEPESLD